MTDGSELLDELMRFKPESLTPNAWAVRAGVGRTIWADLRRHGNPSRRTLSKLLEAAGSSLAEFEALRVGVAQAAEPASMVAEQNKGWGQARLAPLPLVLTRAGGTWDHGATVDLVTLDRTKVVARLPRPPSLVADPGAYAIMMVGESMRPRFRQGRQLAVSPAAPVVPGNDVLVILGEDGRALIGELRSRTGNAILLGQHHPPTEFEVAATNVEAVHKVLGELLYLPCLTDQNRSPCWD